MKDIVPVQAKILFIRGHRVMADSDLAEIYGVTTKRLNEQVRRNKDRFPLDFMFRLTRIEAASLRSQNATLKIGRGKHRKFLPYAFTEHGAIMLASVLNSSQAVKMSVYVVRAFVKLREAVKAHRDLAYRLDRLERKYDHRFKVVFEAIRNLMEPPKKTLSKIGFRG